MNKDESKRLLHNESSRRYYSKNRVEILRKACGKYGYNRRKYYMKVRLENLLVNLVNAAKDRAKRRNLPFDISLNDLEIPDACPVLGIPLQVAKGRAKENSPSIDRIDSSKGYTKDNVRVISMRANLLKNNATLEEIKLIYEDAIKNNRAETSLPKD